MGVGEGGSVVFKEIFYISIDSKALPLPFQYSFVMPIGKMSYHTHSK